MDFTLNDILYMLEYGELTAADLRGFANAIRAGDDMITVDTDGIRNMMILAAQKRGRRPVPFGEAAARELVPEVLDYIAENMVE